MPLAPNFTANNRCDPLQVPGTAPPPRPPWQPWPDQGAVKGVSGCPGERLYLRAEEEATWWCLHTGAPLRSGGLRRAGSLPVLGASFTIGEVAWQVSCGATSNLLRLMGGSGAWVAAPMSLGRKQPIPPACTCSLWVESQAVYRLWRSPLSRASCAVATARSEQWLGRQGRGQGAGRAVASISGAGG